MSSSAAAAAAAAAEAAKFLQSFLGEKQSVEDLKTLSLAGRLVSPSFGLNKFFPLLRDFSSLERLDISANELKEIPAGLQLPHLRWLNVAANELTNLDFLKKKSLPSLNELIWSPGNEGLSSGGDQFHFIAVYYCKKLTKINDVPAEERKTSLNTLRKSLHLIIAEVRNLHDVEIKERVHAGETPALIEDLWTLVRRRISDGKRTSHYPQLQEIMSREILNKVLALFSEQPQPPPTLFETSEQKKILVHRKSCPPVRDYDPVFFLRCHSADERKGDKETKIWRAAFCPGSHTLATCGGNYVCLIDCAAAKVVMKYKLLEEDFYSVAWSRMKVAAESADQPVHNNNNSHNGAWILATSGFRGSVRLLRADRMTCVAEVKHHRSHVNSLLFHPSDPQLLFTGSADLSVCLWRFDPLAMPSHRTSHALLMKFVVPTNDDASTNDVLNLLLRGSHLLAATENDFVCWNCANIPHGAGSGGGYSGGANASSSSSSSTKKSPKLARQRKPEFQAELPYMSTEYSVMDGMTQLGNTPYVASKYYKDGVISIWDFDQTVRDSAKQREEENVDCRLVTRLKWSDTDELYINIGASPDGKLVLAGDDQGAIWMYNLKDLKIMGGSVEPTMKVGAEEDILQPSAVLEWPDVYVEDPSDSGLDLDFDEKKIMINYLTVSDDEQFIVGCTDVNIVCVWKLAA